MSQTDHNPFATRFTRPGALAYLFPTGDSADSLLEKLRQSNWQGEIIGPHGSGKSTLLAELMPRLAAAGRNVAHVALHQGEHSLPISRRAAAGWNDNTQIIVDGYEQLSWWSKRRLLAQVKSRGAGLLITAHEPAGLPKLLCTEPSLTLARQIVARLLPQGDQTITDDDVARAFAGHPMNLREMLFSLYDLYRQRRSQGNF